MAWALVDERKGIVMGTADNRMTGIYYLAKQYDQTLRWGYDVAKDDVCHTIYDKKTGKLFYSLSELAPNGRLKSHVCKCR